VRPLRQIRAGLPAAACAIAVAACGGSHHATVDAARVARAITDSARSQRHQRATVSCPTGVPLKARQRFYCVAQVGSRETPFLVTETNARGAVSYVGLQPNQVPLLSTARVAAAIRQTIHAKRGKRENVLCPASIPRQQGLEFVCAASTGRTATYFVVREINAYGRVSYRSR
jgi:hypothetical protein